MSKQRTRRRGVRALSLAAGLSLCTVAAACSGDSPSAASHTDRTREVTTAPRSPTSPSSPYDTPTNSVPPPQRPVTIAFAGDVHFAAYLAARLDHPETAMGPMARDLAKADLAVVNLETAVTTRGTPQSKEFVFRAPPVVFSALKDAGIDVVTMANNHALDYGPVSVPDALRAARAAGMPVVGLGEDEAQAFRPWYVTVHGQRIAFLGATAVLDADLVSSWSATPSQPGVAAAIDGDNARIVQAVRQARRHADVVVVELHYGSDLQTCPTEIQRNLAHDLVRAGANVVVGQHAHVLLGGGYDGQTYVDYGMGNFQFYAYNGTPQAQTGVLEVTVEGGRVVSPRWFPGEIVNGLPTPLTGTAAREATAHWDSLRGCAGLSARPSRG